MKSVLIYSSEHFDPASGGGKLLHHYSSAGTLARTLYGILSQMGTVEYFDQKDPVPSRDRGEIDLLLGIGSSFARARNTLRPKRSIFFAVNMHPRKRNKILLAASSQGGRNSSSLAPWDLLELDSWVESIEVADHIFLVGNEYTKASYVEHGVPSEKISLFSYHTELPLPLALAPTPVDSEHRFLFLASDIGLRKGVHILERLVPKLIRMGRFFRLDIVGRPSSAWAEATLNRIAQMSSSIVVHGWVEAGTESYQRLLSDATFLLYPTLEEGQAGTVVEALSSGVIPLTTKASGIDFAPLGYLEPDENSPVNELVVSRAMILGHQAVHKLREQGRAYYDSNHSNFPNVLRSRLESVLADNLAPPRLTVVLAVFNKEKTLIPLLDSLCRAMRSYGNAELVIIFDGCKDQSQTIGEKFLRTQAVDFRTMVTPDIFEVKTNNIGLKMATGAYSVVFQDDNFIYDAQLLRTCVDFLERNPRAAVLGALAGVNIFPRGTRIPDGGGQRVSTANECYWRQDLSSDVENAHRFFEVDACMRGPLFFRNQVLRENAYLDESYAPLYNDDMDYCARVRKAGYQVFAILGAVENKALTMAHYNPERARFFDQLIERNSSLLYARHEFSVAKDYCVIENNVVVDKQGVDRTRRRVEKAIEKASRIHWTGYIVKVMNPRYFPKKALKLLTRFFGKGR